MVMVLFLKKSSASAPPAEASTSNALMAMRRMSTSPSGFTRFHYGQGALFAERALRCPQVK
jgi:hypothetical protein